MKLINVRCPFCGAKKLSGNRCPQCGREAVVLGVESKEECPRCGEETRPFEMQRTRDCHGIPFRRVCLNCYDEVMSTVGYDGEIYDERDENLDCEY